MQRRQRWLAIGAALWLLLGAGATEQARRVAESTRPSGETEVVRARPTEVEMRGWVVERLQEWNPRLSRLTSTRIADAVLRCTAHRRLDPDLVLAVILAESDARVSARSPKGAIGLMQVMPHMFEQLELPGNVAHIEANVEAGCLLLADNIARWGEDRGISAYFWGSRIRGDGYLRRVQRIRRDLSRRNAVVLDPAGAPDRGRG